MDFLNELENMAAMAVDEQDEVSLDAQARRFQALFSYSHSEAKAIVEGRRQNLSRTTVSNAHWELVREEKEAEGYDREAYEYALELGLRKHAQPQQEAATPQESKVTYLVKLEGPLDSAQTVQQLAAIPELPGIVKGTGDSGDAIFCLVNAATKKQLLSSPSIQDSGFSPTFVRVNMAEKCLSSCSLAPTLGSDIEPTLPQFRADTATQTFYPTQDQYPVLYFFYGTLADPEFLARKLDLPDCPILEPATISGGTLRIWGGKYKALVDGPTTATVSGWAYEVACKDHEDQLRFYETDQYEVVRCDIRMQSTGETVKGLTFRFTGTGSW